MNERRKMLLVFLDETDTAGDMPLYEAIVRRLVRLEIAGATVHAGIMGYGSQHHVHRKRLFGVSDDRPVTILAVDSEEKIRAAAPEIRRMATEGLVALLDVEVVT
ncbi:MAG: DUF190 domain-containing protein [Acidobacteria bacterium]|nr:DUF190 domain-containing protein [Acidobacteriota bacterium]